MEAFSFSSIEDWRLDAILALPEVKDHVVAAGYFNPQSWVQFQLLWRMLVPHAIVSDGRILEAIEDEPDFLDDWITLTNPGSLTFDDGAFLESFGTVYVDHNSTEVAIPFPLTGADAAPPKHDTPVAVAMAHAQATTGARISTQDQGDARATVTRSLAFYEYPDPNVIESKARDFLLNRSQVMGRWRDFAEHGYRDEDTGALVLASTLSSIFHGPFRPQDVRVTSDHALQFSVPVLLLSRFNAKTLALLTAWTFRDGPALMSADIDDSGRGTVDAGMWLSTAFADREEDEYAMPLASPFGPETRDWERLVKFVEAEARGASSRAASDASATAGFLWIPRGFGRQEQFFKWVRLNRGAITYRRRAYGGPVALYALEGLRGLRGETEVSTAMRLAQTLFGTVGIRSYVSLHFD